jgi:TonB family protein
MYFATKQSVGAASITELQCSKSNWITVHGGHRVQSATRKSESAPAERAAHRAAPVAKRAKLSVLLITRDDTLWPQIGAHLDTHLVLKQVDSIDELLSTTPSGQAAVILWDARDQADAAAVLSRLQLHSPRFAVIPLDEASNAHAWTDALALRQAVAHVAVPIANDELTAALQSAQEEVNARMALLGDGSEASAAAAAAGAAPGAGGSGARLTPRKIPWVPASIIAGVLLAGAVTYGVLRPNANSVKPTAVANSQQPPRQATPQATQQTPSAGNTAPAAEEQVDLLIEKAQQAMTDRHFIDPADGSALTLYRNALLLAPDNGEARQGLQRLAEILFSRVQSALDERKFDVALQALETARSINPNDGRLSGLDERIATMRAEFGPAQILAAINAQNFDRAAQLIDEAARTKSLNNAKLAQLRDELRRRHAEADIASIVKLIDTRLQQDKLTEPRNDSAGYYLNQARAAGASAAELQAQSQEIYKRLTQTLHAAIEQRRFADADRVLTDLRGFGAPASMTAALQRDLTTARAQQAAATPEPPQYLDLAQSRLSQGKVIEPATDSALFYINQLRAADPRNSALPRISSMVQAQILEQARGALDAGQPATAEPLLQTAASLGASAGLDSLNERLIQMKLAGAAAPDVVEASLTRVKNIQLDYPGDALRKNVEGWVDLSYVVTTDGKVTKVKVLDSNPTGVFDAAASKALSRLRYKPMLVGGKATAVSTKLRIAFRLAK